MRVQFTIVLMLLITEYVLSYKHCINLEGSIPDIFKERKSILLGKSPDWSGEDSDEWDQLMRSGMTGFSQRGYEKGHCEMPKDMLK